MLFNLKIPDSVPSNDQNKGLVTSVLSNQYTILCSQTQELNPAILIPNFLVVVHKELCYPTMMDNLPFFYGQFLIKDNSMPSPPVTREADVAEICAEYEKVAG